jgi:hypothetical protein
MTLFQGKVWELDFANSDSPEPVLAHMGMVVDNVRIPLLTIVGMNWAKRKVVSGLAITEEIFVDDQSVIIKKVLLHCDEVLVYSNLTANKH